MKVYLLVWASQDCFDGDDYVGIYTNLNDLKSAFDKSIKKGSEHGLHLEFRVFEELNSLEQSWSVIAGETKINNLFVNNL